MLRKIVFFIVLIFNIIPLLGNENVRIKDISSLQGVRENQLIGYGVVVGLNGSGDTTQNAFTFQTIANYLDKMGISLKPRSFQMRNTAAVAITASLPPFPRIGQKIDVTVSSIGSAKSIQGGTLLIAPLKGADGKVYAVAQGPVSIGGYNLGQGGSNVRKNHPNVGRIPGGATIEDEIDFNFSNQKYLTLTMNNPDFTTAARAVEAINKKFGDIAAALDSGTIEIMIPDKYKRNIVFMVSVLENISITPDNKAKIVINERTGTIVFGNNVKISKVALAHGNISISVKTTSQVSQPNALADGNTVVTKDTKVEVDEAKARFSVIEESPSIGDLVKALNALGATPRDIIAILQAIKKSGALQAEMEII